MHFGRAKNNRIVCWFSCGAASAVATKIMIELNSGRLPLEIVYTEVIEEHPDNRRFLKDCENWFGVEITILRNEEFSGSIYQVFKKIRYLKGPSGAACTRLLKKYVRERFERALDLQVFGYTFEEQNRADRFRDANSLVDLKTPLIDLGITKKSCFSILDCAGIELPAMYKLGYKNNNCIGCVKGEAGYWNKIRVDFPKVYEQMARMEEYLGRTVCKIEKRVNGKTVRTRPTLRELPPNAGRYKTEADISCGIFCIAPEDE